MYSNANKVCSSFLNDANVPMHNKHLEWTLRVIPIHKVSPNDYLVDVLQRTDQYPASQVHELIPRIWKQKFVDKPMRSDLYR